MAPSAGVRAFFPLSCDGAKEHANSLERVSLPREGPAPQGGEELEARQGLASLCKPCLTLTTTSLSSRCKPLFQKLMEKTGVLVLFLFGASPGPRPIPGGRVPSSRPFCGGKDWGSGTD